MYGIAGRWWHPLAQFLERLGGNMKSKCGSSSGERKPWFQTQDSGLGTCCAARVRASRAARWVGNCAMSLCRCGYARAGDPASPSPCCCWGRLLSPRWCGTMIAYLAGGRDGSITGLHSSRWVESAQFTRATGRYLYQLSSCGAAGFSAVRRWARTCARAFYCRRGQPCNRPWGSACRTFLTHASPMPVLNHAVRPSYGRMSSGLRRPLESPQLLRVTTPEH